MKVLITGAAGQLGRALRASAPADVEVVALTRAELDIAGGMQVAQVLQKCRPDALINAAAYNAVDAAERQSSAAERINCEAVGLLAEETAKLEARFLHVSTDYVFDGATTRPYRPDADTNPLNVYGRTKRDGENHARAANPRSLIVRTSTLYGATGNNLLRKLAERLNAGLDLRMVCDQRNAPTSVKPFAAVLWGLLRSEAAGLFHVTDEGAASPYEFALAVLQEMQKTRSVAARISPITAETFAAPAKRPSFSVLDTAATWTLLGTQPTPWRENLHAAFLELAL